MQPELNIAALTKKYNINRWFRNFGARPYKLFDNPLNDVKFKLGELEYRHTYHNGAGITFHSKLLSSSLLVRGAAHPRVRVDRGCVCGGDVEGGGSAIKAVHRLMQRRCHSGEIVLSIV